MQRTLFIQQERLSDTLFSPVRKQERQSSRSQSRVAREVSHPQEPAFLNCNASHTHWSQPKLQLHYHTPKVQGQQIFGYEHCLHQYSPHMVQSSRCLCYYCCQPAHPPLLTRCYTLPAVPFQPLVTKRPMPFSNQQATGASVFAKKRDQKLRGKLTLKKQNSSSYEKKTTDASDNQTSPRKSTPNEGTQTFSQAHISSKASITHKRRRYPDSLSETLSLTSCHAMHEFQHKKSKPANGFATPTKIRAILTPPSLQRCAEKANPIRKQRTEMPLIGQKGAQNRAFSKKCVVYSGEFDYDSEISRQAYTGYLNPVGLKDRVKIKFVEPVRLGREVADSLPPQLLNLFPSLK